jgi:hypothetical protein
MLIDFKNIKIGDEILIPSNSNLKYLKVISITNKGSLKCSLGKNKIPLPNYYHTYRKDKYIETDITKHNSIFYLKDDRGYTDIWLVKREIDG